MKEILIISGKGGTGKTTVAASLAHLAARDNALVLADADVDAANLELLLSPSKEQTFPFMAGKVAVIDPALCTLCGRCEEVCRFDAVRQEPDGSFRVDSGFCEGCLSCFYQCPASAIRAEIHQSGEWYRSSTPYGTLFHANLYPGEENSGKLVTQIKEDARAYGKDHSARILLIDGPPGIGCPVTAACNGVDLAVIVSEPTLSGFHDLRRVKAVTDFFHIPTMLVINKHDLNMAVQRDMLQFAQDAGMPLAGLIPYDEGIMRAQLDGRPITESLRAAYLPLFETMWAAIHHHSNE
jgi:MinD superfamily P-loop ATPase